MTKHTLKMITAMLEADPTLDTSQAAAILNACKGGKSDDLPQAPRVYTRHEAAKLLKRTPQRVDQLARQGLLVRVHYYGKRCAMYTEESIFKLLRGEAQIVGSEV